MKKTLLIVGESGSGKSYLCNELSKYGLTTLESYSTRKPRYEGEKGHIFISKEQYDQLPDKIATTYFDGNYYCATKQQVDDCDLYVIDVEGVKTLKSNYKGDSQLVVIGLRTSEIVRYARMLDRGDTVEMANARIRHDREAFQDMVSICDVILDSSKSVEELAKSVLRLIA